MSGPVLTIGRGVIADTVRMAALGIPGVARVARGGPGWRAILSGPPITTHVSDAGVSVQIWIVSRPGQPLVGLAKEVRDAAAAAVERLLGMRAESIVVTVDGVGG